MSTGSHTDRKLEPARFYPLTVWALSFVTGLGAAAGGLLAVRIVAPALLTAFFTTWHVSKRAPRYFIVGCAIVFFFLGALRLFVAQDRGRSHVVSAMRADRLPLFLVATVCGVPVRHTRKWGFPATVRAVGESPSTLRPCRGRITVWLHDPEQAVFSGSSFLARGRLYKPYAPVAVGSGRLSYGQWLERQGIGAIFSIRRGALRWDNHSPGSPVFFYWPQQIRAAARMFGQRYLSAPAQDLLDAMVFGARATVPAVIDQTLRRTGTVHVLAVSGLHVGIVAVVLFSLTKLCGARFYWRCGLTALALVAYCWIAGARASIVRATIMAAVYLAGFLLQRTYNALCALSLAALLILTVAPLQIYAIGFQLSFASVGSIILLGELINDLLPKAGGTVLAWLRQAVIVSCSAWLGTVGLVVYYFAIITPIAVVANLVIVPLVGVIVAAGVAFYLGGPLHPVIAAAFAYSLEAAIALLVALSRGLERVPGAWFSLPALPAAALWSYYGVLGVAYVGWRLRKRHRFAAEQAC